MGRLCALLERTLAGENGDRHHVLILTGDIHNARYTLATVAGLTVPPNVHELVASPTSPVGPYLTEAVAKPPPTKFPALRKGRPSTSTVVLPESDVVPTVDNNAATVTMSPGTAGAVRFELADPTDPPLRLALHLGPHVPGAPARRTAGRPLPKGDRAPPAMIRNSGATERNPRLVEWSENVGDGDNMQFFADALGALAADGKEKGGLMTIGLLGQRDLPGVRLRNAQAILRRELHPSLWSHVFIVAAEVEPTPAAAAVPIREISLYSRTGESPDPANNGVTTGTLGLYRRPQIDANVALIAADTSPDEAKEVAVRAVDEPNLDRLRFNFWEMLGVWESYLWSSGTRPNPLRDGPPSFCSAFAEYRFEAIRVDLSPGASERNSAPAHLWNGAAWWDEAFAAFGHQVSGSYALRDKGCSPLAPDELQEAAS